MNRRTKYSVGIVLVALALILPNILQAQGTLTLDGLATQVKALTARLNDAEREDRRLGAKIAALENRIAQLEPTSTPTPRPTPTRRPPTATPRPTRRPTPKPTAMPSPCRRSGIPEPPSGVRVNCDAWEVTYQLATLASGGYVSDSLLPQIARDIYPMVVDSDRNCGVGVSRLADMVYTASRQMEALGKPSGGGSAIGYLLGVISDQNFKEIVKEAGGTCQEAISLIVLLSE